MPAQFVPFVELSECFPGSVAGCEELHEGFLSDAVSALRYHEQYPTIGERQLPVVQSLLGLVQIDVHGVGGDANDQFGLSGYRDAVDIVGSVDCSVEAPMDVPRCCRVDAVVSIQYCHYREDRLLRNYLESIDHVVMNRISIQGKGRGFRSEGVSVILLDGLERSDSRQEGLSSARVTGEVVGFDGTDDDDLVCLNTGPVDVHLCAVLRCTDVDHVLFFAGIMHDHVVTHLRVQVTEDLLQLLLGGCTVYSRCNDESIGNLR